MLADVYLPLLNLVDMVQTPLRHLNIVIDRQRFFRCRQQVQHPRIVVDLCHDKVLVTPDRIRVIHSLERLRRQRMSRLVLRHIYAVARNLVLRRGVKRDRSSFVLHIIEDVPMPDIYPLEIVPHIVDPFRIQVFL